MQTKFLKTILVLLFVINFILLLAQQDANNNDKVIIVAGGKIENGNINQMVLQLYINKKAYRPYGFLLQDFDRKRPSLADADYVKLDSCKHGFVFWEVKKKDLSPTSQALIYITSIGSSNPERVWWYSCFRSWKAGGNAPITATDDNGKRYSNGAIVGTCKPENANWTFLGCKFDIVKSGLYYAGDFNIQGNLSSGVKTIDQIALIKETSSSDTISLKSYLKKYNLSVRFIDMSNQCNQITGIKWWSFIEGNEDK